MIRELIAYRHLFWMLTWRDIRIRYHQTLMGFTWVLFMPLLFVGAGLVISRVARLETGRVPYPLFMLIGVLPWSFFVSSLKLSTNSLVANANLVTKIYFPREVFPIATITACLTDFLIGSLLVIAALVYYAWRGEVEITPWALLVPLIVAVQVMLMVGLGLILSMANLFFRDVKYIVDGLLTVGIFATAVYYPLGGLFLLNPMNAILDAYRATLAYGQPPDWMSFTCTALVSVVILVAGWVAFDRCEPLFAESI